MIIVTDFIDVTNSASTSGPSCEYNESGKAANKRVVKTI